MGDQQSGAEEWQRELKKKHVDCFLEKVSFPELRVNEMIQELTNQSSSETLKKYYNKKEEERKKTLRKRTVLGVHAADWTKSLAEMLTNLIPVPGLPGLTMLAITILIDIISFGPPEESRREALRSMFAEEKTSEVWDQIDECLKRCMMHIKNRNELVSDIKRIEGQLSATITKLKNSMVRDGHMSNQALRAWDQIDECLKRCMININNTGELVSDLQRIEGQLSVAITKLRNSMMRDGHMSHQALRAWVNGAAFHVQMMIYLVTLGGIQTQDPVEGLIVVYLSDLDLLFEKHKEVIKGKCQKKKEFFSRYLVDEDSKDHKMGKGKYRLYFEAYYDHKYNKQKCENQKYFDGIRNNLQKLVQQRG